MIGALIGAAATIGSSLLGMGAADEAAEKNWQINLLNYYQRENERFQTVQAANKRDNETKLGSTDSAGNRTHFVDGVGWVSDLSPESQQLQSLYQNEELQQFDDLNKKRDVLGANVKRQGQEGAVANQLLDAFGRVQRSTGKDQENLMNQSATKAINEGFDTTLEDAMRSSIRSGASNSGKVAANIGEKKSNALLEAFMNNQMQSGAAADAKYDTERGNIANVYNMFASRASAMPDVAYNPRNIEGMGAQQQAQAMGAQGQSAGALINAFAKQGGTMSPVEANYGAANALGTSGQAIASAMDASNSDRLRAAAFNQYGNSNGLSDMYKQNTGWF